MAAHTKNIVTVQENRLAFPVWEQMANAKSMQHEVEIFNKTRVSGLVNPLRLLSAIKRKFEENDGFFQDLMHVSVAMPYAPPATEVRVFQTQDINVVIKYCGVVVDTLELEKKLKNGFLRTASTNGSDINLYHDFIEKFSSLVLQEIINPDKYALVPIRVFGTINVERSHSEGDYRDVFIAMERIEQEKISAQESENRGKKISSIRKMQKAFEHDLSLPIFGDAGEYAWQSPDLLLCGNTAPENPEKGRWVVALPHDIG